MELTAAIILLNTCVRSELRDHAFGDAEVSWTKDGKEIAGGYFGRDASVWINDGPSFKDDEARQLRRCGSEGHVERNDETGPESYSEGNILPGLTKEAVFKELTS